MQQRSEPPHHHEHIQHTHKQHSSILITFTRHSVAISARFVALAVCSSSALAFLHQRHHHCLFRIMEGLLGQTSSISTGSLRLLVVQVGIHECLHQSICIGSAFRTSFVGAYGVVLESNTDPPRGHETVTGPNAYFGQAGLQTVDSSGSFVRRKAR